MSSASHHARRIVTIYRSGTFRTVVGPYFDAQDATEQHAAAHEEALKTKKKPEAADRSLPQLVSFGPQHHDESFPAVNTS